MYWPDNPTSTASPVSPPAVISASPSYFTSNPAGPTIVDDWLLNMIVGELVYIVEATGGTPDKSSAQQCGTALAPAARAVKSAQSDTGFVSTLNAAVVIGSETSRAWSGQGSFVAASLYGLASGQRSAVIASRSHAQGGLVASGQESLVAASFGADGAALEAGGTNTAILASSTSSGGGNVASTASQSAAIACREGTAGFVVNGHASALLACVGTRTQGTTANACAAVACSESDVGGASITGAFGAALGQGSSVYGDFSAGLACAGGTVVSEFNASAISSFASRADGVRSSVLATREATVDASEAVVIASGDESAPVAVHKKHSALVASGNSEIGLNLGIGYSMLVASDRAELVDDNTLALGYHATTTPTFDGTTNKNLTIKFSANGGNGYFDGGADLGSADYAELFELARPGAPLPVGRLITLTSSGGVALAGPGDPILGVSSAAPSVLGNAAPLGWSGRWETDEFGAPILDAIPMVRWAGTDERPAYRGRLDEVSGEVPEDAVRYVVEARREVKGYDASRVYVPRSSRPDQWCKVGLLGQVRLSVAEDVVPGDVVEAGPDGIGQAFHVSRSAGGRPVRVMRITSPFDASRGYAIASVFVG